MNGARWVLLSGLHIVISAAQCARAQGCERVCACVCRLGGRVVLVGGAVIEAQDCQSSLTTSLLPRAVYSESTRER